jgi:hypothetical protein
MPPIWTTPRTWATGELVTAAQLNQHLRDNLDWLKAPAWAQHIGAGTGNYALAPVVNTWTLLHGDFDRSLTTLGGRVLIHAAALVNTTATGTTGLSLEIDGVMQGNTDGLAAVFGTGNAFLSFVFPAVLSAGPHTIRLMARLTTSGTITVYNHPSSSGQRLTPLFWIGEIA